METVFLARLQFALTIAFHYIFPPLSIGLGVALVIMEGLYLRTRNPLYHAMTRFWVKVFGLTFSIGVASGIVMEFQFGMNWATYSRYVGDVFGSALAAEGIFAFFLESGFLAILLFGWNRVRPGMHFFSTVMVCLGAHFSAIWIIVANSWMQTPAGFHVVTEGGRTRAEIVDFWALVFNPSSMTRLAHTVAGAWQAGALLVVSVSAYYLLRRRHEEFARASMRIGLGLALVASVASIAAGHHSALLVAQHQPAKLAAMEGHYGSNAPADLYVAGWVDEQARSVRGVRLPGMLSFIVHGDRAAPLRGLDNTDPITSRDSAGASLGTYTIRDTNPPVNLTFQGYHVMVLIGGATLLLSLAGVLLLRGGRLFSRRGFLWLLVFSVLGPQIANQAGWMTAEVGRQPWIVYGVLRTADAVSVSVPARQVTASLVMFGIVYALLFALFIFLLDGKIRHGPDVGDATEGRHRA